MSLDYRRATDTGITSSALAWTMYFVLTVEPVTEDEYAFAALVVWGQAYPRLVRESGSLGDYGEPTDVRDLLGADW